MSLMGEHDSGRRGWWLAVQCLVLLIPIVVAATIIPETGIRIFLSVLALIVCGLLLAIVWVLAETCDELMAEQKL